MDNLLLILLVVAVVVAAVVFLPRLIGGRGDAARRDDAPPERLGPAPGRPDDPDQVDEASQVVVAAGGQVRPGDAATVQIADPAPWGLNSFDLDLSIGAVSRAEIRDATGLFSFMVYWMPADQDASVLMVEGDVVALAEVFVGRLVRNDALRDAVVWCRGQYLIDTEHSELDFDLSEHELGTWTGFAAREGGSLRIESGSAELLPAGAAAGEGLPYRDFTLYQGSREAPSRLRLVQVAGYAYLFQGEVAPLRSVTFLRRTPPPGRR
jgi:hypothetical protein